MPRMELPVPAVGEWVQAYSPGVWQVIGTISGYNRVRQRLDEPKRVEKESVVFAKRLVDDKWRKSFRVESCEAGLIESLDEGQQLRLREYLSAHPDVAQEFAAFRPNLPGFNSGMSFNLPHIPNFDERRALVDGVLVGIEQGLTKDEILERVATSPLAGFESAAPKNITVILGNKGYELRDGDFVFRSYLVQPF